MRAKIETPYEGYPADFLAVFGWGMLAAVLVLSVVLSLLPWSRSSALHTEANENDSLSTGAIRTVETEQKG